MAGFRIAEGFIEVTVDDSRVSPGIQQALQQARSRTGNDAQQLGRHLGQQIADGMADGAGQGGEDAGQEGGGRFSTGFLASAGAAMKTGVAGLAVATGAVFTKGFTEALAQGDVTRKLQVQLGATPQEAKKYGNAAGYLYTHGITDTFEEGANAIKLVMQQGLVPPKATNAQLQSIAGKVTDLSKTFDIDLAGATNAVSQMMRTGLAKNATEALDLLTVGAQKGADKAGDLVDTFNEYSTQFRKVGLDGKTAMGLLSQGLQAGARDADIVADAIKEFSIRAIDGSESTVAGFQALGFNADDMAARIAKGGKSSALALDETLDKLRAVKDPVERSRIAVQLFGTQAEDLGEALYALDPSEAVDTLGKVGGAADEMGKTLHSGPTHNLEVFKRTLEQGVVNFIGTYVVPVLTTLGGFLQETLSPAFNTVKTAVGGFISSMGGMPAIMEGITGFLSDLGKTALSVVVPMLKELADSARRNLVPALMDLWSLLKTNLWPVIEGLIPIMKSLGSTIGSMIVPVLNGLMVAVKGVIGFIKDWQNVFVPLAAGVAAFTLVLNAQKIAIAAWSVVTKGASAVTKAWAAVQAAFNLVMAANPIVLVVAALVGLSAALVVAYKKSETFRDIVNGAWSAIKTGLSIAWEYIKKVFGWLVTLFTNFTVPGLIIKHWDTIKNATKATWDWIKSAISTAINTVKTIITTVLTAIKGAWDAAWGFIKNVFSTWWSNFKTNITNAWNWLKTQFTNVKNAITKTWSDAWNAIKKTLADIWSWISTKVTNSWSWLKTQFTNLKTAITKTWSDAWNAIKQKLIDIWSWISTKINNSWTWLKGKFTDIKNAITKTWSDAWGAIKKKLDDKWSEISRKVNDSWSWLKGKFTDVKNSITKTWSDAWNGIKTKAYDIIGKVQGKIDEFKGKIKTAFRTAKEGIAEVWEGVKGVVKKPINYVIDPIYKSGIKGLWDKVAGFVGMKKLPTVNKLAAGGTVGVEPGIFNAPTAIVGEGNPNYPEYVIPTDPKYRQRALNLYEQAGTQLMDKGGVIGWVKDKASSVGNTISGAASSVGGWIKDKAKDLAEGATEPFFKAGMKVVNGLINKIPGINTGFGKMIKALPKHFADGIMSWLKGKDTEASGGGDVAEALRWARSQHGKPYQWGGAGNPSWDCSGFMSGIQKVIDGKSPNGRLWSTFSFQGSKAPAGWVRHLKAPFMIGITNKGKGHTAGTLGGVNVESRGGDGVLVGSRARGYKSSLFHDWYGYKPSKGGGDWSARGSGVNRWRPHVIKELKDLGLSTGWQDTVLRRMNQESGGDPNVVNKWDSNWKAGHPSVGLMQVIRGTFAAYAGKHRNQGPFKYGVSVNPYANIHAGLNYANKRYGSLSALNRPGGYDSGGWLPPGATLAVNKTGKPEAVLTNEQWTAIERFANTGNPVHIENFNVTMQGVLDPSNPSQMRKAATFLRDEIRKVERAHR